MLQRSNFYKLVDHQSVSLPCSALLDRPFLCSPLCSIPSQSSWPVMVTLQFSSATYFNQKPELLLPIKRNTIPFTCSLPSSLLNVQYRKLGHKSKSTPNRICCKNSANLDNKDQSRPDLGIVDFMKGKNILITGATGFVAKVLVEKILRVQPDIGKLFLIIRADDSASALKRLKNEVMNAELFKALREGYGNEFQEFMLKRLIPIAGDMMQHDLGIKKDIADMLRRDIDIIVSSAANTTFNERYDVALETNTKGVYRLLEFAKCCEKIKLFMHLSTAYVNGQSHGRSLEKPLEMTQYSIIAEENTEYAKPLDIEAEFHLANKAVKGFEIEFSTSQTCKLNSTDKIGQRMKDLGMERARAYGWQDTYGFTKAMGEMLIVNSREDLPVVIVRPSVIEGAYTQPFPGWIEGHRMLDPIITQYAKGRLSGILADPDTLFDLIPVDMVVNATLAAMAKHAQKPGLKIYHVASSVANPIKFKEIMKIIFEHFKYNPYVDNKGKPIILLKQMVCFPTMKEFSCHVLDTAFNSPISIPGLSSSAENMSERKIKFSLRLIEHSKYLAKVYKPYFLYKGRFDISNLEELFQELSKEEQNFFGFDIKNIKWKEYIGNIHIPGLRQYVLKGRGAGKYMTKISSD